MPVGQRAQVVKVALVLNSCMTLLGHNNNTVICHVKDTRDPMNPKP